MKIYLIGNVYKEEQMKNNSYTILSIGPIYDSFMVADNTRAIWTVSFMFSYLMKETIRELYEEYKDKFLVPNVANEGFQQYLDDENYLRVGVFHDRLIIKEEKNESARDVNNAFQNAVGKLADIVANVFRLTKEKDYTYVKIEVKEEEVKAYIKAYFQSYIATVDVPKGKNPILELSKYMDAIEYQPSLLPYEEKEFMFLFFRLTNLGLLQKTAFGKEAFDREKERCFKSLPEIAAWELLKDDITNWKDTLLCLTIDETKSLKDAIRDPNNEAKEIYETLKDKLDDKDRLKPYHKYVAIVHGDGDSFGKYLERMEGDEAKIKKFTDNVFRFTTDARDAIRDYGGYPVIGSGEDLLFFAPVIDGRKNIFTLIHAIDKIFKNIFKDQTLSMSYGISISYYKFPLQESIKISQNALWSHAKTTKWVNKDLDLLTLSEKQKEKLSSKNAIHINIQKHSGQSHRLTIRKDTELYCQFVKLLLQELSQKNSLYLPHALHHSLDRVKTIVDEIPSSGVEHLFTNMFNENIHKTKHKKALKALQEILKLLKDSREDIHKLDKNNALASKPSEIIFSMLSTIKMLRGDR